MQTIVECRPMQYFDNVVAASTVVHPIGINLEVNKQWLTFMEHIVSVDNKLLSFAFFKTSVMCKMFINPMYLISTDV